jgi:uncharacterized protein YjdB
MNQHSICSFFKTKGSPFLYLGVFTALLLSIPAVAKAAGCDGAGNCYVRAGAAGSGSGADWTNAYTALPSTLTRGVTYYVAGGTYPNYAATTPASGTTSITIQAATLASYGTSTGWSNAYATDANGTGSNPAAFNGMYFTSGYWTINGSQTYSGIGCGPADPTGDGAGGAGCNIKIIGSAGNSDFSVCPGGALGLTTCPTHISASYIEIAGCGYACSSNTYESGIEDDSDGGTSSNGGGNNFSFSHFYIHQVRGGPVFWERANTITLDHSYIIGNASTTAIHAEAVADMNTQNVTISNNAFVAIEGSGYIVELDRGGCQGTCPADSWNIYGNIFWSDSGNRLSCQTNGCNNGIGDGVIACINALVCTNWHIYQNDFVNLFGLQAGLCQDCTGEGNVNATWTVENNIWWNNTSSGITVDLAAGCSTCKLTEDYNTVLGYNAGELSGFTGAHDIVEQSTPASPFVGWSASPANFELASENSNWDGGVTLATPFNIDPLGVTRGVDGDWDRGAMQINSSRTLQSISVTPSNASIATAATEQFAATGTYSDGSTQNLSSVVTWVSSYPGVASISTSGLATGVSAGSATIEAVDGSITGSTGLTVTAAPAVTLTSIAITPASSSITPGGTTQLAATGTYSNGTTANLTSSVTWTSTSSAIATVSASGLATGVSAGSVTITAASGSVTGSTGLTVTAPPAVTLTSITITPASVTLVAGSTAQLTATGTYSNGTTANLTNSATWTSTSSAVATVSASGLVTGVASGTVTIKATSGSIAGSETVTITAAVTLPNPLAWWKFDAGSGTTAVDSSGNNYTATLHNGVTWVTGQIGDAVSANGTSQYLSTVPVALSAKAVTWTAWVKRTYGNDQGALIEDSTNFNNSTTGFGFFPDDSEDCGMPNTIMTGMKGNVGYALNCYTQPTSGVWHHFAAVYDKSQPGTQAVQLYIDGVLQTPVLQWYTTTNTNSFSTNNIYMFSRGGASNFASGALDDLRVFNSALTGSQIAQIYQQGLSQ